MPCWRGVFPRGTCPCSSPAPPAMSSGVPSATMVPPPAPPSGPMSMIQSDVLITSRLCSMTITVLPLSTRPLMTSSNLRMSSKCRPVVGSFEDVDRAPGGALLQLGSQLHSLRLTTGQRGRRLAQAHIPEADIDQRLQNSGECR